MSSTGQPQVAASGPSAPAEAPAARSSSAYPSPFYAWYVVGVLTLAYVFSFLDRQIIGMMIGPIKRDFALSDAQVGLLGGTSFALFYTFFGIPVARWADTRSRRSLVAVGFVLWSLMTAAGGLARQFWHLLLCRVGVGVGEATLSPAAYSLIADYFPPRRRATAISVYSLGIYLGGGLSLICLGLLFGFLKNPDAVGLPVIGPVRPWQALFFLVGLPGIPTALLLYTVREVPRRDAVGAPVRAGSATARPLREVWGRLHAERRTFLCLALGAACATFGGYANSQWMIELFARRHGWTPAETGVVTGLILAASGTLGAVAGGRLTDSWQARGRLDAHVRVALLAAACSLPIAVLYPLAPTGAWAAVWLAPYVFLFSLPFGVLAAAIQQLVPPAMRAQASAIYLFIINLVGLGLGPLAVGWLSDQLSPDGKSLHLALLPALLVANAGAVGFYGLGLAPFRRSMQSLHSGPAVAVPS